MAKVDPAVMTAAEWAAVLAALAPEVQEAITFALVDSGAKWGSPGFGAVLRARKPRAAPESDQEKLRKRCRDQRTELRRLNQKILAQRAVLSGPYWTDSSELRLRLALRENDWHKEREARKLLEAKLQHKEET